MDACNEIEAVAIKEEHDEIENTNLQNEDWSMAGGSDIDIQEEKVFGKIKEDTNLIDYTLDNLEIGPTQLTQHKYNVTSSVGLLCKVCNASFLSRIHLSQHYLKYHTDILSCESCDETFTSVTSMIVHLAVHGKDFRGFGQTLGSRSNVRYHGQMKSSVKRYKCTVCQKYYEYSYLRKHYRIHSDARPFKCTMCNLAFKQSCTLRAHEKIHKCERRFQCEFCAKSFFDKFSLQRHSIVHSKIKAFKCDVCGISVAYRCTLRIHQRIHTGEKPYSCGVCEKAFKDASSLRKHEKTHTKDKPLRCDLCDKNLSIKNC